MRKIRERLKFIYIIATKTNSLGTKLLFYESRMLGIVILFPKNVKEMEKRRVRREKTVLEIKEIEL